MGANKYLRRRRSFLPTLAVVAAAGVGVCSAIEWGDTTSSTSDYVVTAPVGEITTVFMEPGGRANIEFQGDPSNHFAVSYRQCSEEYPQPLQIQYSEKLNYVAFPGGCIYAENEAANGIGEAGCTFWQYNPTETYATNGIVYPGADPLEPGRVRFENQGNGNASVEVAMYSVEIPKPLSLASSSIWIEDTFVKKDRVLNTTVNVYFNANDGAFSYCDEFSCSVTGYMNEYVEGKTSLSLCQVEAGGAVIHDRVPFASSGHIPLSFNLPESSEWYVTLVLAAKNTTKGSGNYTALVETGQDRIVVLQTDSTQADSSARAALTRGLSMLTVACLILFNTLLSSLGSAGTQQHETVVPSVGW